MLFNSHIFLFAFLPVALAVYHLCADRVGLRKAVLLVASIVFYAYWDWRVAPILFLSILFNWGMVRLAGEVIHRNWLIFFVVASNLGLLGFFKYSSFAVETVAGLTGLTTPEFSIIVPLGISFFTFQQISYVVDARRGQAPRYALIDYAVFVSFFPQLVAGPIVRHQELIPQIIKPFERDDLHRKVACGLLLFTIGMAKKVLIADQLSHIVNTHYAALEGGGLLSSPDAWIAVLAFSGQIYFDFSGYSDIAIGLALMFGFTLPFNFDAPYRSVSIQDFWRRWHITLGTFLRDYLYIPLGGSRGGFLATALVLMATMTLAGLWHGAAWTFVIWGAVHGLALVVHRIWRQAGMQMVAPLAILVTFVFVTLAWVPFRAPSFAATADMFASLFLLQDLAVSSVDGLWLVPVALVVAVFGPTSQKVALELFQPARWIAIVAAAVLVVCAFMMEGLNSYDFIYFQF